jgi:hypothetical protein
MCYWILLESGIPIVHSTIQSITAEQWATDEVQLELKTLDSLIKNKLGDPHEDDSLHTYDLTDPHIDDIPDHITPEFTPIEPEASMPEVDDWDAEAYDQYIAAEVQLSRGGKEMLGTVIARKHDRDGNPIGRDRANPVLDTRMYEVIFPDGDTAEYTANVIAECLYSQIDIEGNQYLLLQDIIDWKRTQDAVEDYETLQVSHNGNIHKRRTTKGWKLCVLWKDGTTSWENLKDLKESFPIQVAEFAYANNLQEQPAFRWWVTDTLSRRNRILKAVKTRYAKKTHKYGIRLPKSVEEAYELDRENGTDHWHQAILRK